jgi:hypothetical protein
MDAQFQMELVGELHFSGQDTGSELTINALYKAFYLDSGNRWRYPER